MIGSKFSNIASLKFNNNEVSDIGFIALVDAIEKKPNEIAELSFVENCITDKSANFLVEMIKRLRN